MSVKTKGFDELQRRLDRLANPQAFRPALMAAALHVKGKIAVYPPSTEANQPRGFNSMYHMTSRRPINTWYQRGYGPKWVRKDGSVKGRKTSETLRAKWTIASRDRGLTQVIGNNVSYGPFVQSAEKQAGFHGRRGWKTDEQVIEEEKDTVMKFLVKEVERILTR